MSSTPFATAGACRRRSSETGARATRSCNSHNRRLADYLPDVRNLVRGLAAGRILFGAAMLLKPEEAVRGWIGSRAASQGGTQTVTRAFGARDMALGAGALAALMAGKDAREWVVAGAVCDMVDFAATATAEDIPLSGRVIVLALAGSAIAVSGGYVLAAANGS